MAHRESHPGKNDPVNPERPTDYPTAPREPKAMSDVDAVGYAEGWMETDDPEVVRAAWQHLVDTGMAWSLQGWFGRTAQALIEAGEIRARVQ